MFIYQGTNEKIAKAVALCNSSRVRGAIRREIAKHNYEGSTTTGENIALRLTTFINTEQINVVGYARRFTKAIAYFSASRPRDINLNTLKLNRSIGSICGTIYHETIHMVDDSDKEDSYGHGSNSNKGKEKTAPYLIGSIVKKIVDDENTISDLQFVDNKILPWYLRFLKFLFGTK